MEMMVSGLKVSELIETGATHNLVGIRTGTSLHNALEFSQVNFKEMNSEVKPMT